MPKSLDGGIRGPNDFFERIGSPHLCNMDSLIFWLRLETARTPGGFAGGLTQSWITLILHHCNANPAVVGIFAIDALMVQGGLIRVNQEKYINRVLRFLLQEAERYTKITSVVLMIILYLGNVAGNSGDLQTAEKHFAALKSFYHKDVEISELEWMFLWSKDISIATRLKRQPLLPWRNPPTFEDPILISAEESSKVHRLAANNSASMLDLVDVDFFLINGLLWNLHLFYGGCKVLVGADRSIHAYTLSLLWKTNSLFLESNSKADKTRLPIDLCMQLLALAVLQSAWYLFIPHNFQETRYIGENASFPSIPTVLRDRTREIFERIGGTPKVVETWSALASLESFVWISFAMTLKFGVEPTRSPWISLLYQAASFSGITSGHELRALLARWPCDLRQVDTIVDGFVSLIQSPSAITMPVKQS